MALAGGNGGGFGKLADDVNFVVKTEQMKIQAKIAKIDDFIFSGRMLIESNDKFLNQKNRF